MRAKKTLWSDISSTRHFLIPDGQELPPGDFVLLTITGRQQEVDAEALVPFAVTQEEAKDWFTDQVGQFVEKAKEAVLDALKGGLSAAADQTPRPTQAPEPGKESPSAPPSSPGLRLLSALSGEPVDRLRNDKQSMARAGGAVLDELGGVFDDATAGEEDRLEAARRRVRRLRGILLQQGLPVSDKMEGIPDQLHELYHAPDRAKDVEPAAAGLEVLADGLERAGALAAERLRALAERLREPQSTSQAPEQVAGADDRASESNENRTNEPSP